jgi:hypothetical protein
MNKSIPEVQSRQEKEIVQQLHAAAPQPPHLGIYIHIYIYMGEKNAIYPKKNGERDRAAAPRSPSR